MKFDEYQKFTATVAQYPRTVAELNPDTNVGLLYIALGLCGEVGELANKIKKVLRDDNGVLTDEKREFLKKESGDALWYWARLCEEIGVTCNTVAVDNVEKLTDRKERGVLKGDGDNR